MSKESDNYDIVGHHNAKWLAPKDHIHPASANITKQEQYHLATLQVIGPFTKEANDRLKQLADPEYIKAAQKAFDDELIKGKELYDKTVIPAETDYTNAITPLWNKYNEEKDRLDSIYENAIAPFNQILDDAYDSATDAYNAKMNEGKTMDEIISDMHTSFVRSHLDLSAAIKALRSQQITKREASQGAGASLPTSEPKRSLWDKLTGKNKPAAEPV